MKYPTEQVFVVPYDNAKHIPDKFTKAASNTKLSTWSNKGKFVLRSDAEYNKSIQQLIPYILIKNVDNTKLYVTRRIAGDKRLQDSLALGCGGHINPEDAGDIIMDAATRELNEEMNIELAEGTGLDFLGYVRDLGSETSEHLGFVFVATAEKVSVKEKESLEGMWMGMPELVMEYNKFETWAKHIIDYLFITHTTTKILE